MSDPDYAQWVTLHEYLRQAASAWRGDAQVEQWLKTWTSQIEERLVSHDQGYRICDECNTGGHTCPGCGADVPHGEIACDGCSGRAPGSVPPWSPDYPGCAPETCGGSRLDPCADSLKTEGRTHDILGDEMKAAGLDPDNLTLRHAVREKGGVTHYLVALEIAEHEARQAPEREVPVSQLVSGDSVYSPSTKTWHEVRRATSGQLYFQRDGAWTPVNFAADVRFLARRGDAGAAAALMFDAFGGKVIEG